MAARAVVGGVAGICSVAGAVELRNSQIFSEHAQHELRGNSAGNIDVILSDEVIDVEPSVVTVAPEQVKQTKSGAVTVLPEDAAHGRPEAYWAPDPETGVFAPDDEHRVDDSIAPCATVAVGDEPSVLEQTAWIREVQVEEAEKPDPDLNSN